MTNPPKEKPVDILAPENRGKLIKYVIPIAALSISFLLVPLTLVPLYNTIGALNVQKKTDLALLSQLNQKQQQISAVRRDIGTYRDQFTSLDVGYPTTKDVPALVLGISRLVDENGLILDSYRLNPGEVIATPGAKAASLAAAPQASAAAVIVPEAAAPPPIIPTSSDTINPKDGILLEIITRGSLTSQRDFIKAVSEIRRVLYISSVALSLKKDDYTAKTIIEVPYNGLPETLLPAEEPLPQVSAQVKKMMASLEALPVYTNPL